MERELQKNIADSLLLLPEDRCMAAFRKTAQLIQMISLVLALTVLWGAESWIESKQDDSKADSPPAPDDLSDFGIGSFIGS